MLGVLPPCPACDTLWRMRARSFTRTRISFDVKGATCAGYIYLPEGDDAPVPCVVMANGFSGTMDWILPGFAERFAAAGLAVLIFD